MRIEYSPDFFRGNLLWGNNTPIGAYGTFMDWDFKSVECF